MDKDTMSGQTTVSKQAPSPSLTSSSAEPEQQTELVCPECGSTHVRRSQRTGPSERFRGLFGFYPYRCRGCSSRFFLKTSSNLLRRPHTTGPIKRFREILGLFTYRWHEYLSRFFRPPRKWPAERRRAWHRTRRQMLVWAGGIVGFLAILYYLIRDTGPKQDQP
jgi:DNA-directed RNA polymerase subunit RPC12/RpoP